MKEVKYSFENNVLDIIDCPHNLKREHLHNIFVKNKPIKKIILPDGVVKLGEGCFSNLEYLENINIPLSVREVCDECFKGCIGLEKINFNKYVKDIGKEALFGCSSLKKVVFPDNLKTLGSRALHRCPSLNYIKYPVELNLVNDMTVGNSLNNVSKIVIPEGVEFIEDRQFYNLNKLHSVHLPSTLVSIGKEAFYDCEKLTYIDFKENLVNIDNKAFSGCNGLNEVVLPDSILRLGNGAFMECRNLRKVVIGNNIEEISDGCFSLCDNLEDVKIGEKVQKIGEYAFDDCSRLKKIVIPGNVKEIGRCAFLYCSNLNEVVFEEGVEQINSEVFYGCHSLRKVVLPKSIKHVKSNVFDCCSDVCDLVYGSKVLDINYYNDVSNAFDIFFINGIDGNRDNYVFIKDGIFVEFSKNNILGGCSDSNELNFIDEANYINLWYWTQKNKFIPHYTVIENMPIEDIDLFYINNNCKKWADILSNTSIQVNENKATLFKLCYVLGVFQESGKESDKAVEFIKDYILPKMSENAIHYNFDGLDLSNGFNPLWAEFFMKYYKENSRFLSISADINYICASYNNFDKIMKVYPNKVVNTNRECDLLLPCHVIDFISSNSYCNVDEDNKEFAMIASKYGYSQEQFSKLQKWYNKAKLFTDRELKLFINEDINDDNEVNYNLLNKDNPLGAFLGNITNCCQVVGGAGESCVEHGMCEPNSRFMTFSYKGDIIGQSWVWYDEASKTVCLDNIEVPHNYCSKIKKDELLQEKFVECLKRVANNFVSEMKEHKLDVNNVTIGKGYNDINYLLDNYFNEVYKPNNLNYYNGYSDASKQYSIFKK